MPAAEAARDAETLTGALRIPAAALERVVIDRMVRLLAYGRELLLALRSGDVLPADGAQQRRILTAAASLAGRLPSLGHVTQRDTLLILNLQVEVLRHELTIRIGAQRLVALLMGKAQADEHQVRDQHVENGSTITLAEPVSLQRSGRRSRRIDRTRRWFGWPPRHGRCARRSYPAMRRPSQPSRRPTDSANPMRRD